MKRIDLWKAQLKGARVVLKIRTRESNAAVRATVRQIKLINELERKIGNYMAKS